MNLAEIKFLLKKYRLTPNKIRGQNFLISDEVLTEIIRTAKPSKKDLILEIGPGLASLTQKLINQAGQVVAFEIDNNFRPLLNKLEKASDNFTVIWRDILALSDKQWRDILAEHKAKDYKIVANIPYYLTAKFIKKFLLAEYKPQTMTLMLQKEVAERIVAADGKGSLLSLSVNLYARAKLVRIVEKDNFYPQPKVDSAILYIYNINSWLYAVDERKLWQLIRRGFAYKRKKLINNLASDRDLDKEKIKKAFDRIGLDKNVRAENLTVDNWLSLAKHL